jgi:3-hydroxyacyl-CoA dehydrogenase
MNVDLNDRLKRVAVVGAAGKMGSGITLLLALEMAYRALERKDGPYVLSLIDMNQEALEGLLRYVRDQARKDGERQVNRLRRIFQDRPDLVENGDMVRAFEEEVLVRLRPGTTLELAREARLVFEAAFEKEDLKTGLYRDLARICPPDALFFTNTSSIPIHRLGEACAIQGRLVGFHFYNPPAVQKLLEFIAPPDCGEELARMAEELARLLGKKTVPSNDVAGFIGNGHFIRDGLFGLRQAQRLAPEHGFVQAVHLVDTVSRDYLLRPMGIFQLVDYVGIDVFQLILRVMDQYLGGGLHSDLVDRMLEMGVRGGQRSDGSQKDGFLKYEKNRPAGVFDPAAGAYLGLDSPALREAQDKLGPHPEPGLTWKALQKDPGRNDRLRAFFQRFREPDSLALTLAREHFLASRDIAQGLVDRGVARRPQDVNDVLTYGFFHLYGPINDFLDMP